MQNKRISIIVPVYKGCGYIENNLRVLKESMNGLFPDYEILVVIDGNPDSTYEKACNVKGVKVVGYSKNMGKGYALKYGFSKSTGDYITFMDGDLDLHPLQLKNFFPYMASADIVIGSKRHPFSKVKYPLSRKILSKGFQLYSRLVLGVSLSDTQSGLKLIKREVLEVLMPLVTVKRYAFDLELMFLAQKHNFRTVEAPLHLNFNPNPTSINFRAVQGMFLDVLGIRYRYSVKNFYQKRYHAERFG